MVGRARGHGDAGHRRDPVADRPRDRRHRQRRPRRARAAVRRADRRRRRAARLLGRAADRLRQRLAGRRVRPAQRALRAPAGARARLLRPPADRPADVARDRRPAVDPLLPRLRLRVDRPERADDPLRGRGDVRPGPRARRHVARAGAVRRRRRIPLRAPLAAGHPGGPAADRRADRGGGGERLRRARGQGVRGRAAPARALPPPGAARVRPGDVLDAAERLLPAVHRLPAAARPGGDPDRRRPARDRRHADAGELHGLLHVPADADRADALARHRARLRPARDRVGRAAVRDPRRRAPDRLAGGRAAAARGQRARGAARRLVQL